MGKSIIPPLPAVAAYLHDKVIVRVNILLLPHNRELFFYSVSSRQAGEVTEHHFLDVVRTF